MRILEKISLKVKRMGSVGVTGRNCVGVTGRVSLRLMKKISVRITGKAGVGELQGEFMLGLHGRARDIGG